MVAHSDGGLYVPAVIQALGDQVRGAVFVVAAVPGGGHHTTRDFLNRLAVVDGQSPPWTSWWNEADITQALPDPKIRVEVEAEQPRMLLAYDDHLPPTPDGWESAIVARSRRISDGPDERTSADPVLAAACPDVRMAADRWAEHAVLVVADAERSSPLTLERFNARA